MFSLLVNVLNVWAFWVPLGRGEEIGRLENVLGNVLSNVLSRRKPIAVGGDGVVWVLLRGRTVLAGPEARAKIGLEKGGQVVRVLTQLRSNNGILRLLSPRTVHSTRVRVRVSATLNDGRAIGSAPVIFFVAGELRNQPVEHGVLAAVQNLRGEAHSRDGRHVLLGLPLGRHRHFVQEIPQELVFLLLKRLVQGLEVRIVADAVVRDVQQKEASPIGGGRNDPLVVAGHEKRPVISSRLGVHSLWLVDGGVLRNGGLELTLRLLVASPRGLVQDDKDLFAQVVVKLAHGLSLLRDLDAVAAVEVNDEFKKCRFTSALFGNEHRAYSKLDPWILHEQRKTVDEEVVVCVVAGAK